MSITFPVVLRLTPLPVPITYPSNTVYPSSTLFPAGGLYLTPIE